MHGLVVSLPVAVRPDLRGHAERQQRVRTQPDEPMGGPGQGVGDVRTRPSRHEDRARPEQVPGRGLRGRRHHRDVGSAEAWRARLHDQHLPDRGVEAHCLEHGARVALEAMGDRIHDERPPVVEAGRPTFVVVEVVGQDRLRNRHRAVSQRADPEGPADVVRGRDTPQVGLDRVHVRTGGDGEQAFLPGREVGHVEGVLVQELALDEGEALAQQLERRRPVDGVEGQDAVDEGVHAETGHGQVVRDADLVLLDDGVLVGLGRDRVQPPPELRIGDDLRPHRDEVGADVEHVGHPPRAVLAGRHRHLLDGEPPAQLLQDAGREVVVGGLESPPVDGPRLHAVEHLVQGTEEIAAVVDEEQLVVRRDRVPTHEVASQLRVGTEVVEAVPDRPPAAGVRLELLELTGFQDTVGQVVDVGEPAQLADVGDHGVVDDPVPVEPGEQAHTSSATGWCRRGRREHRLRDRHRAVTTVPPLRQEVDEWVDELGLGIEVGGPVPPQVELRRWVEQHAPAVAHEVTEALPMSAQRPRVLGVVPDVAELLEPAAREDEVVLARPSVGRVEHGGCRVVGGADRARREHPVEALVEDQVHQLRTRRLVRVRIGQDERRPPGVEVGRLVHVCCAQATPFRR